MREANIPDRNLRFSNRDLSRTQGASCSEVQPLKNRSAVTAEDTGT